MLVGWPVGILPSMLYTSIPSSTRELDESVIVAESVARVLNFLTWSAEYVFAMIPSCK